MVKEEHKREEDNEKTTGAQRLENAAVRSFASYGKYEKMLAGETLLKIAKRARAGMRARRMLPMVRPYDHTPVLSLIHPSFRPYIRPFAHTPVLSLIHPVLSPIKASRSTHVSVES